jgi:TrmH family RNA methyltransferase
MLIKRYEISSAQNDKFKWLLSLREGKNIRDERACLVFGTKIVQDLIKAGRHKILFQCLRGPEENLDPNIDVLQLSAPLFDELDEFGTHAGFLVVQTPPMTKWTPDKEPLGLEIISPLQDPTNLGGLARTAVAFGCKNMVLTKESANPFLPRTIKSSSGAILDLHLFYAPTLLEVSLNLETRKDARALDMVGESIHKFHWPSSLYLLLGEEGRGLPKSLIPKLHIPIQKVESLNATIAAALAISAHAQSTLSNKG